MFKIESEYNDLDKYQYNDENVLYCKKNIKILHNPYGPAMINVYKNTVYYYIEGKLHRLDGPAIIYKKIGREEYYINNKYLTKEEFEIHPERLKYLGKENLVCLI